MNGRMYDPILGRMLSTDNFVQNKANTQDYNRYTYAINNPMRFIDPSGEFLGDLFGGMFKNTPAKLTQAQIDRANALALEYAKATAIAQSILFSIATAGAFSALPFANTLGIIASSAWSSLSSYSYSGGKTDIVVGFGVGSYNFSTGELGHLGNEENSALEDVGFALGALANISDSVTYSDKLNMAKQQAQTPAEQREIFDQKFKVTKKDKYILANGKGNPRYAVDKFGKPKTPSGWNSLDHDITYYDNGADGALSAFLNTSPDVLQADKTLLLVSRLASGTKYAGQVKLGAYFFIGFKSAANNAYFNHIFFNRR
jgi:hypothetical protein